MEGELGDGIGVGMVGVVEEMGELTVEEGGGGGAVDGGRGVGEK